MNKGAVVVSSLAKHLPFQPLIPRRLHFFLLLSSHQSPPIVQIYMRIERKKWGDDE
jgi:hypothetical protein